MKVVILHDALTASASADQLDVLAQIEAVSAALIELGHEPVTMPFSLDLPAASTALERLRPDLVFNMVESVGGRGRLIYLAPALLDSLGIPYTGAGTEAMFQTSCKTLTKERLIDQGIATPAWHTRRGLAIDEFEAGRYIIKSVWEDASIGLDEDSVIWADQPLLLREEIERRLESLGGNGFAEAFIDGREFNLALLADGTGPRPLAPSEILFVGYGDQKPRVVGYRAKWDESSFEYQHTQRCFEFNDADRPLLELMAATAGRCWRIFGLRGYARVDFRVDGEGRPWVLEINANPCLSPDAGFGAAVEGSGLTFGQAIESIMEDANGGPGRDAKSESVVPQRGA